MMRIFSAIAVFSLMVPCIAHAGRDSFKVSAPITWKKISTETEYGIYQNSKDQFETVVVQKFARAAKSDAIQDRLASHASEISKIRATLFRKVGLGNYSILEIKKRTQKSSDFPTYQEIQSRFLSLDGSETQMLERQYWTRESLFVVTYLTRGPALNDRVEVDRLLNLFKPLKSSRTPASEVVSGTSTTVSKSDVETSDAPKPKEPRAIDMKLASSKKLCEGVPEDLKRKPGEGPGFDSLSEQFYKIKGCATGVVQSLWGMITGFASLVVWVDDVTAIGKSDARDQAIATAGAIASEIKKGPLDFAWRIGSGLYEVVSKEYQQFPCYSNAEQMRKVCKILGDTTIPVGLLMKLATRTVLTAEEAAKLAGLIKKDLPAPAAKLVETTSTGERIYEAGSSGVVVRVADSIPSDADKIGRFANGLTKEAALKEAKAASPSQRAEAIRQAEAAFAIFEKLRGNYGDLLPTDRKDHAKLYELILKAEKRGADKEKIRDTLRVEGSRCSK